MNKDFNMEAVGYMIDEESEDRYVVSSIKPGDGAISIIYSDYSCEDPCVGNITVYSNGVITCSIENQKYLNKIYNDYVAISGEKHEPLPEEIGIYREIISKDEDVERFKRVKIFLAEKNIELKTASEREMENEMISEYEDVTVDDLVASADRQEEKDYDEGEYHHL